MLNKSRRYWFISIMLLCGGCVGPVIHSAPQVNTWLCYYGDRFGPEVYDRFDLVVLDAYNHPKLMHRSAYQPIILAYLSVGEVDEDGPFWDKAKDKKFLVQKNQFWNSRLVDVRDPAWQKILLKAADNILSSKKEFDGLFLDTFDSSLSLEELNPVLFRGVRQALRQIVVSLKKAHPGKLIAVNRGLPMLPDIAHELDFVVIEDLSSLYAGPERGYVKVDPQTTNTLLRQVREGRRLNPHLTVLTLDYADPSQKSMAQEAISFSRKHGFVPYVSTYKLDQVFFQTLEH